METNIEMVMCGHCEKKITPNLIASFGNDHHDPDEMMCESCFNGRIAKAESQLSFENVCKQMDFINKALYGV